uniref:RNA helicase n=1 Tax=Panagrellus redivivus TaxID=6233 RepID=A0A7E4ZTD9_PANRE
MLINYISEVAPFTSSLRYKLKKDQNCQRRRQRYRTKPTPTHQEYHASKIRKYFIQQKCVACYVKSLQPFELVAGIVKRRSDMSLNLLRTLKNCVVTVRRGIHHSSLNTFLEAISYVSTQPELYEKLLHVQPNPIDLMNLPDFRGFKSVEMPESVYEKVPSTFIEEQKTALKALTRQSSKTFVLAGAPGTGKTFVLVEAALRLIMAGARVLFVSTYFITADSIAQEFVNRGLCDKKLMFRALGNTRDTSNLSEDWMKFSESIKMPAVQNIEDCSVVITTFCLLYKTSVINKQKPFTHIFIDDAQYTSEKSVWDVLYQHGHKDARLILCGNPYQNYFENTKRVKELQTPLFRIVSNANYDADSNWVLTLTENRRSHKAIVDILARLCYEDNLKPSDSDEHHALCNWEHLPNPGFPVMFHNVNGEAEDGINQAEADVVIKYLTSLRNIINDDEIHLSSNRVQIKHIRSHFDSSVNVFSRLFEARYPRAYIISYVDNGEDDVILDREETDDNDDNNGDGDDAEDEVIDVSDTASEVPSVLKAGNYSFNPTYLNRILSSTSELVVIVGHAATMEQKPAWKQFIDYCRENKSYIE